MAHQRPDLYRWKRLTKNGNTSLSKVHLTDGDINQWMKRVEMASEFAVSEVFSPQKRQTAKHSQAVALQRMEQLQDHDDAYSEAQAILSDWMNTKLRLELEMDEEEEELTGSSKTESLEKTENLNDKNFNDMYSQLAQEDESFEVNNFLQDLMDTEVLDCRAVEGLRLDAEMEKKHKDPSVTIQVRHQQVKERRLRRDAEREKQRKEQEVRREARKEAQKLELDEQRRRRQEARRQEDLIQQEMKKLRREMEEKRSAEQLARKIERERLGKQRASQRCITPKSDFITQRQLHHSEQTVEARLHILNLQCMQKHFSAWYSVVLLKRVWLGKAAALCDWRRQLRAWRAWRALVWVKKEERETWRMEEELRLDNRRCQVAAESDRKRLLRRCLSDWRLWCRMEKERKELLSQQEETRRKIATLINTAASARLTTANCPEHPITAITNSPTECEDSTQPVPAQRSTSASAPPSLTDRKAPPTQAWQVTRRHAALSPVELHQARERQHLNSAPSSQRTEVRGGRFEHRHMAQQQTIAEQRRLLKEQQELILHLQEKQNFLELRQEADRAAESAAETQTARLKHSATHSTTQASTGGGDAEIRSNASREDSGSHRTPKTATSHSVALHPAVQAMEQRARLRAERRKEVEEVKRRREEEKLAQMKAAEEERLRQEEEEKRITVEKRKEERRQQKEKELEKQRRIEREQTLLKQAQVHYHRSLLLHRGLEPWKRLVEDSHTNTQKAVEHYRQVLQRRCLLFWLQNAGEVLAEKEACADQLYTSFLFRRAFCCWKKFQHLQRVLEKRAEHFYRTQTLRKSFTALLDHATHQRLLGWDKEQRAEEHNARRSVRRCFFGWRRLPAALREERERETRRERLRRKVSEILPDFRSSPVDNVWSSTPSI